MTEPKPRGWDRSYAEWFDDASVVQSYRFRPEYPAELFTFLASLAGDSGVVLDAGCGPGDIARPLAPLVARVDAIDLSPRMIAAGRRREGGDSANLIWIAGAVEEAPLHGPYDLVVAGDSVHWFDWPLAIPRLADALAPEGRLAVVSRNWFAEPGLRAGLAPIYSRFGANRDFRPLDAVAELERRGLFVRAGEHTTVPTSWRPTLDEILGCHHSQNGFDAERMDDVAAFDEQVAGVVRALVPEGADGRFELETTARVVWGRPS